MNNKFDIGNYQANKLELTDGQKVIAVYKNNYKCDDSDKFYTVVYLTHHGNHKVKYVRKDGTDDYGLNVVLKRKVFDLNYYFDKLDKLKTTDGTRILGLFKPSNPKTKTNVFLVVTESIDGSCLYTTFVDDNGCAYKYKDKDLQYVIFLELK